MSKKIYIGDVEIAGSDGKSAYQSWLDQGNVGTEAQFLASLKGADGEDAVGFESVSSPATPDGSMQILLTNGDTITIDLNHNHPQYLKYVYLTDESQMPATPDATTLYLILDNSNA